MLHNIHGLKEENILIIHGTADSKYILAAAVYWGLTLNRFKNLFTSGPVNFLKKIEEDSGTKNPIYDRK